MFASAVGHNVRESSVILCFVLQSIRRPCHIAVTVGKPEQVHLADGGYVKLFLNG